MENGAVAVRKPEDKEWGQKVGYVRDINGIVVRMGSYVKAPKTDWMINQLKNVISYASTVDSSKHFVVKRSSYNKDPKSEVVI